MVKIILFIIGIWLIFKLFGRYIFLFIVKRLVKRLEDQTLKSMRYHQRMYNDEHKHSFHHESGFKVIVPNKENNYSKIFKREVEEVGYEEMNSEHENK